MRPRRLPAFDYCGCHRYLVTCCTWRRQLLLNATSVPTVSSEAHGAFADRGFDLIAWVFMPDHVHWLVQGTREDSNLKAAMTLARQRSAIAYKRACGGSLWQNGYHERVLRRAEDANAIARYILNNPVRAGLVQEPGDYLYSWSITTEV